MSSSKKKKDQTTQQNNIKVYRALFWILKDASRDKLGTQHQRSSVCE